MILILVVSVVVQYLFFRNHEINKELISNAITFLSLIFGFYASGIAIIGSSNFAKVLAKKKNSENTSETLLHTLVKSYKSGILICMASIAYFFILSLVSDDMNQLKLSDPLSYIAIFLLSFNIYYGIKHVDMTANIVIKEASFK